MLNTYIVTFVAEPSDDELEKDPKAGLATCDVSLDSHMEVEDVAAGDYDAHEWLTRRARRIAVLARSWEAVHITLPNGDVVATPAGL